MFSCQSHDQCVTFSPPMSLGSLLSFLLPFPFIASPLLSSQSFPSSTFLYLLFSLSPILFSPFLPSLFLSSPLPPLPFTLLCPSPSLLSLPLLSSFFSLHFPPPLPTPYFNFSFYYLICILRSAFSANSIVITRSLHLSPQVQKPARKWTYLREQGCSWFSWVLYTGIVFFQRLKNRLLGSMVPQYGGIHFPLMSFEKLARSFPDFPHPLVQYSEVGMREK